MALDVFRPAASGPALTVASCDTGAIAAPDRFPGRSVGVRPPVGSPTVLHASPQILRAFCTPLAAPFYVHLRVE